MTEDPVRAENMRLRTELTTLQKRHAALERELGQAQAAQALSAAQLDGVLRSNAWKVAVRLGDAAGRVPAPLRQGLRAGLRAVRGRPADPEPEPTPAPESAAPDIPDHAQFYGLFTQDDAALAANPCFGGDAPRVSIIILNWNRAAMTLACVRYVLRHTAGAACEILIADNGSEAAELAILAASALPFRVLPMGANLFFGEANNVAAEQARGEFLFFLNNDAFVHDDWLAPLIDAIERVPRAGAAGSQLRYPNGKLQEAGSLISPNGIAHQIGKQEDPADERFSSLRQVDYVSAAAMLIRRADFLAVLGFELCYEPAYYEDVDLCMKLRSRGLAVVYCPDSIVTHVENATSLDRRSNLRLENIIQVNRATFVARWGDFLLGHPAALLEPAPPYQPIARGRPRVALHSPFMLTPGGGERYLLSIGQALAAVADVTLVTATPCSAIRLRRVGQDLNVDVSGIALMTLEAASALPPFDAAFVTGNTVLPPTAGLGRRNSYICQFPFPLLPGQEDAWRPHWDAFDRVLVYSAFARDHLDASRAAMDLPARSVAVVAPPVRPVPAGPKLRRILSVGRFFAGQHCKRQDLMVAAFRELAEDGWELHLAGSLRPEPQHRAFYLSVVDAAKGLPVFIHPNVNPAALDDLYAGSSIYWHLTGMGSDLQGEPELSEHFGIAIVEAMSAGCVPVAFGHGGPVETITDGQDGYLIDDLPGLVARTRALIPDESGRAVMATRAAASAARFGEAAFATAIRAIAETDLPP